MAANNVVNFPSKNTQPTNVTLKVGGKGKTETPRQ
jgi:hypothetical protein